MITGLHVYYFNYSSLLLTPSERNIIILLTYLLRSQKHEYLT